MGVKRKIFVRVVLFFCTLWLTNCYHSSLVHNLSVQKCQFTITFISLCRWFLSLDRLESRQSSLLPLLCKCHPHQNCCGFEIPDFLVKKSILNDYFYFVCFLKFSQKVQLFSSISCRRFNYLYYQLTQFWLIYVDSQIL